MASKMSGYNCTDTAASGDKPKGLPFNKNAKVTLPQPNAPTAKSAHLRHGSGATLTGAGQHTQGKRKGR